MKCTFNTIFKFHYLFLPKLRAQAKAGRGVYHIYFIHTNRYKNYMEGGTGTSGRESGRRPPLRSAPLALESRLARSSTHVAHASVLAPHDVHAHLRRHASCIRNEANSDPTTSTDLRSPSGSASAGVLLRCIPFILPRRVARLRDNASGRSCCCHSTSTLDLSRACAYRSHHRWPRSTQRALVACPARKYVT